MSKRPLTYLHPRQWPIWIGFALLWSITRLPSAWQLKIGRGMGLLVYVFGTKLRHVTEVNIRLCFPNLSKVEQKNLLKTNFASLGMGLIETAMAWWLPDKRLRCKIKIQGLELIEAAFAKKHGVILLGPHYSCLEMIGRLIGARYPFAVLYRPHKNKVISLLQDKFRQKYGIEQIPRHRMRTLLRALDANKAVWYAYDVDGGEKRSVFADFFGIPTASLTAVTRVVELSSATIVPISFYRLDDEWGYEIKLSPPLENFPSNDFVADATRLNAILQKAIEEKPDQYIWQYKRFKTRPDGDERFY